MGSDEAGCPSCGSDLVLELDADAVLATTGGGSNYVTPVGSLGSKLEPLATSSTYTTPVKEDDPNHTSAPKTTRALDLDVRYDDTLTPPSHTPNHHPSHVTHLRVLVTLRQPMHVSMIVYAGDFLSPPPLPLPCKIAIGPLAVNTKVAFVLLGRLIVT